jgi:hypothetical protein
MILRRGLLQLATNTATCGGRLALCRNYTTTPARALEKLQNHNPDWTPSQQEVRSAMAKILEKFDDEYWRKVDKSARFPTECE